MSAFNRTATPEQMLAAHRVLEVAKDLQPDLVVDPCDLDVLNVWGLVLARKPYLTEQQLINGAREWARSHTCGWYMTPRDVFELALEALDA